MLLPRQTASMNTLDASRIVNVDRMNDGLVLKFADGKCVFFSNALLYSKLDEGEALDD